MGTTGLNVWKFLGQEGVRKRYVQIMIIKFMCCTKACKSACSTVKQKIPSLNSNQGWITLPAHPTALQKKWVPDLTGTGDGR